MSSTTKTVNLELSQFVGTDKPAWLTDYNGDMKKIDDGYKKLEDANTATQADLDATKQDLSGSQIDIDYVKAEVQALEAQDIALGNRLTVVEGNYDSMHHEVAVNAQNITDLQNENAINEQNIAVLESENVVKDVDTISNLIGDNISKMSRLAGNAYFIRVRTRISGNTLTGQTMNYICDIDISKYNPIQDGKVNVFIGSALCTYTEIGTNNTIRTYNDVVITNTGKIGVYITQYVDLTKDVFIEFSGTIPVKIVR